jgi:hypothetical protein
MTTFYRKSSQNQAALPQKLNDYIDWAIFKTPPGKAFSDGAKDKSKGGHAALHWTN